MATYSISVRLQRVTLEYAYVSVPVTSAVVIEQDDGTDRVDSTKVFQQAIEMGSTSGVKWHHESLDIRLHPTQKAPEPEERELLP